ncbi:MAG: RIP metalloprotease RseP [Desulfonauticus sp.]|nr:RIP metalloprotease RseP [Desulfonauticus sp.]
MNGILAIIFVLGLLIFFHELGHFLVARVFKIGVSIFSLGFGPKLVGFSGNKTEYRLSAIPLGGYVKLVGEKPDEEIKPPFTEEESFSGRPAWQKLLVVGAGPIFNFLLAWFIFWGLFFVQGKVYLLPSIGKVLKDSPAYEAGLKPGDLILEVNHKPIKTWSELVKIVQHSQGKTLVMLVQRKNTSFSVTVKPKLRVVKNIFGEAVKVPQVGIVAANDFFTQKVDVLDAAIEGWKHTLDLIKLTWMGIVKLIERILPLNTIGGPLTIAKIVTEQARYGWVNLLNLVAVLSINLGLLNLLPIPVLDGGHIVFFSLEMLTGKTPSERVQEISTKIGLTILMLIMALAVYNDLMRLFK